MGSPDQVGPVVQEGAGEEGGETVVEGREEVELWCGVAWHEPSSSTRVLEHYVL